MIKQKRFANRIFIITCVKWSKVVVAWSLFFRSGSLPACCVQMPACYSSFTSVFFIDPVVLCIKYIVIGIHFVGSTLRKCCNDPVFTQQWTIAKMRWSLQAGRWSLLVWNDSLLAYNEPKFTCSFINSAAFCPLQVSRGASQAMFDVIAANNYLLQVRCESLQPGNGHVSAGNGHCRFATFVAGNEWSEYSVLEGVAGSKRVVTSL